MLQGTLECWPSYVAVTDLCNAGGEDIRYPGKLNLKDHFAELRAGFEIGMRGSCFRERKHAIDDGLEPPLGHKFQHREQLRFCAHVRTEQRKLATEKKPEIHPRVESSGGPAGYEAPRRGKAGEAFVPRGGANVFEHDINPAFPRNAAHFVTDFLRFVIDEMVRAKLFALLQLRVAAGRRNHARAKEFGNLNCGATHATSGAEN